MAYEYPTNYSGGLNVSGPGGLFLDYPVTIMAQYAAGIILLIWTAVFAISLFLGSKRAILVASFISFIFATFFTIRDWLNPVIPIVLIVITVVAAIGTKGEGSL